jgi:hypothetical protein
MEFLFPGGTIGRPGPILMRLPDRMQASFTRG